MGAYTLTENEQIILDKLALLDNVTSDAKASSILSGILMEAARAEYKKINSVVTDDLVFDELNSPNSLMFNNEQ